MSAPPVADDELVLSELGSSESPRSRFHPAVWLIPILLLFVAVVSPTLNGPYWLHHSFRTTQTADQARIFVREGIDLFHPKLSVMGPHSHLAYEMPWYQAIAATLIKLGLPETFALRSTSVFFTLMTALGVWAITRRIASERAAVWAAGLFLFNPLIFVWGQASLIETFTTAMVMGWLLATANATATSVDRNPRRVAMWSAAAIVCGCFAATSKFTTALPWTISILVLAKPRRGKWWLHTGALIGIPMTVGFAWTQWADHLKSQSVLTDFMMSSRTHDNMIRPLGHRLMLHSWLAIGQNLFLFVGGMGVIWIAFALWSLSRSRLALPAGALVVTVISAPLVFFGLYQIHDYYHVAIVPALSILVGIGAVDLHRRTNESALTLGVSIAVHITGLVVSGGLLFATLPWSASASVSELTKTTRADEQVIGVDEYWSARVLFEADRHGYMMSGVPVEAKVAQLVDTELGSPRALYLGELGKPEIAANFLLQFKHVAAVGKRTYRFSNDPKELSQGPTRPAVSWSAADTPMPVAASNQTIACDNNWHQLTVKSKTFGVATKEPVWFEVNSKTAALPITNGTLEVSTVTSRVRCRPRKVQPGTQPLPAGPTPTNSIQIWAI
jgi:Dolichyl-phosphate-mannose-protein mannosyltransferase